MPHTRPIDPRRRGHTVARVAVMLREGTLSLARRRPVSPSLHLAVSRESGRLDVARRNDEAGPVAVGGNNVSVSGDNVRKTGGAT